MCVCCGCPPSARAKLASVDSACASATGSSAQRGASCRATSCPPLDATNTHSSPEPGCKREGGGKAPRCGEPRSGSRAPAVVTISKARTTSTLTAGSKSVTRAACTSRSTPPPRATTAAMLAEWAARERGEEPSGAPHGLKRARHTIHGGCGNEAAAGEHNVVMHGPVGDQAGHETDHAPRH